MNNSFFAMHSRMKYINRWALMRKTSEENLSEHSYDVAVIAHALALIKNLRFGGSLNIERAAFLGLYHDMPEIITGDMPTPVKYHSRDLRDAFAKVEAMASDKLLSMLPEDMREYYESAFFPREEDGYLWKIVKAADKISALIKCIEEEKAGNKEFLNAYESTKKSISEMNMPEADEFIKDFLPAFSLSLDEQNL
ncbi:MAG: 5'-deoxynucleotidase [Clostridia bacterium]|nr:5'-deoxynucleotidase [Clostridia bacterium]